ncbi:hypothetical protein FQ707_01550 [Bacteroidaceae bacterium HV4-6-C5C]|nr:hypothetical protein FQ707_01550 [Bacteroidaceae bacterium HV4-6-C5C]
MIINIPPEKCHSLTMLMFAIILCSLNVTAQVKVVPWNESAPDKKLVWLPKAIYIAWPDMKLDFMLPDEKDRTGVANLLFRDRESGEILLLDSVKNNPLYKSKSFISQSITNIKDARYYTRFNLGSYDAILLYNNGKYIRYDNITFNKDMHQIIDMGQQPLLLADAESRNWLAQRKFKTIVGERTLYKNYKTILNRKISGYVFFENGRDVCSEAIISCFFENSEPKRVKCSYDGYFEVDIDDNAKNVTLEIGYIGCETYKREAEANSSLFIVLKYIIIPEEQLRNVRTAP